MGDSSGSRGKETQFAAAVAAAADVLKVLYIRLSSTAAASP